MNHLKKLSLFLFAFFVVLAPVASKAGVNEVEVTRKILYAVETGGQRYGNQNYANYEKPAVNSQYITIGAGGWYGPEAKQLLDYMNKKENNATLKKIIKNWNTAKYGKSYKKEIINMINSKNGRKYQDQFMDAQIKDYFSQANKDGVKLISGKMEYTNIMQQGGLSSG